MKKSYYLLALFLSTGMMFGQINLASGTTGTTTGVPQSYNENRGVDVTVLSKLDLKISSMTLSKFFPNPGDTAWVGARIYNSSTGTLLMSSPTYTLTNTTGANITVPMSYTLTAGGTYRLSFYGWGPHPPTINSGDGFLPQSFPYTESSGLLQINQAYDIATDVMPSNVNLEVPLITLNLATTGIDEISLFAVNSVYPNPANQSATVKFSNAGSENCSLTLYDMQVKLLQTITNIIADKIEIERKNLASGLYHFQIRSDKQVITTGIFLFE